jgi:fatty acid-binding protein DegV
MIGICTDSNSQLPESLAERYAIEVVPVTVTIGDQDFLEGVDLDADRFYELMGADPRPSISTSQPSPGQFAAAYEALLQRGCDEILSIHVAASTSGTLNSARLATRSVPVPVRLVDSGLAGFGVSCCVWAAAEAVAHGASIDEAVQIVEALTPQIGTVFVLGAGLDGDIAVLTIHGGEFEVMTRAATMADAVETMAAAVIGWGPRLNVALGMADRTALPLTEALETKIGAAANVVEVVRYRIGPSVGAYAGSGAVGCFMFPAE